MHLCAFPEGHAYLYVPRNLETPLGKEICAHVNERDEMRVNVYCSRVLFPFSVDRKSVSCGKCNLGPGLGEQSFVPEGLFFHSTNFPPSGALEDIDCLSPRTILTDGRNPQRGVCMTSSSSGFALR